MTRTGETIASLRGWRRAAVAFVAGALSALSFAPFEIFPLLLIALAILVLLIDGAQDARRPILSAGLAGWWWGFGQFLVGLYWVAYAFLVDATDHAWQIPFLEFFLPGGLALFIAAAASLASAFWRTDGARVFILTATYAAAEWLRGHILTGFPWNLPAYAWGALPGIMQSAALIGSYGLTLVTVLFGASLALLAKSSGKRDWHLPAALALLFLCLWIGGAVRLAVSPETDVPGVRLRLVQPDVAQRDKYRLQYRLRNWRRLIDPSFAPSKTQPSIVIWPEAAPPFLLSRVPEALDEIAMLTDANRILMTGAVRGYATVEGGIQFANSFYVFGPGARVIATYDKFHLVPFGEYVPLAPILERLGITKLVALPEGFVSGDGPHTFDLPGAPPVDPLICYEIIFPGAVMGDRRAAWIVNVTDDSWFGPSTGPYQHLLTARMRAIEEGVPVVRDANTGISAVIDAQGRVRTQLGLGQQGILDSGLPKMVPITPFARLGDTGFALMLAACVWGGFVHGRRGMGTKGRRKSFSLQSQYV